MGIQQTTIRSIEFEDFDPNEAQNGAPTWAIFDGYCFKTYAQRGHALSAFHNRRQCKLYELDCGRWEERAVKRHSTAPERPQQCDLCGQSTMEHETSYNSMTSSREVRYDRPKRNMGEYEFERHSRKIVDPVKLLHCCRSCATGVRNA